MINKTYYIDPDDRNVITIDEWMEKPENENGFDWDKLEKLQEIKKYGAMNFSEKIIK